MKNRIKHTDRFVLCEKYDKLRIEKDDGAIIAVITEENINTADGYVVVLTPNYEYPD